MTHDRKLPNVSLTFAILNEVSDIFVPVHQLSGGRGGGGGGLGLRCDVCMGKDVSKAPTGMRWVDPTVSMNDMCEV